MKKKLYDIEQARLSLQVDLDAAKTPADRNRLGQFATPTQLARDILTYATELLPRRAKIRFLDPAIGTGAFFSALQYVAPAGRIDSAVGFEIDPHYGEPAAHLWDDSQLVLNHGDFTNANAVPSFNLVVCNPPYVRHHHLANDEKARLQSRTFASSQMKLSGLAGLYCHFLGLSHAWMEDGAIGAWLIPSEFMDVNYGAAVKRYLLRQVTVVRIHRFEPNDVQFADALVSSAIVLFRNAPPPANHSVEFTQGGTLLTPRVTRRVSIVDLEHESKWTRFPAADIRVKDGTPTLSDFFQIKRGIATGDNGFFIVRMEDLAERQLPLEAFHPILPSPRYLTADEVQSDSHGNPLLAQRLFLLDTKLQEVEIKKRWPSLYEYLASAKSRGLHERYLCRHRSPWYAQENRPPAPIVCTYMGRGDTKSGRPFRFILNSSRAKAANVYLAMYPTPALAECLARDKELLRRIWRVLNEMAPEQLLDEGRVYGGGLHKLEPRELGRVDATRLVALLPRGYEFARTEQLRMFESDEQTDSEVLAVHA